MRRRDALRRMGAAAALAAAVRGRSESAAVRPEVLVFTKHLQYLRDPRALAEHAAALGYDGLDLTVRPGGHVEPAEAPEKLPVFAAAAREAGLSIGMVTTVIQDGADPEADRLLGSAAQLGIPRFRIGGWKYRTERPIPEQVEEFKSRLAGIAELAARRGMKALYQNHSGESDTGAVLWDLWSMIRDLPPASIGANFDIGHATAEGGYSWPTQYRLLASRTGAVTFKDFLWERDKKGKWRAAWGPLGEGMIDGSRFVSMLKGDAFEGPLILHFEYSPAGPDPKEALRAAMERDLRTLRGWMARAGWA